MIRRTIAFFCFLICCQILPAQSINPSLLNNYWSAQWISYPGIAQRAYGVYHFRKTFDLAAKPDSFIIHVSADNRYRLFVNCELAGSGPARGDMAHWNFETINIAPYLHKGNNTIAAMVWNMAKYAAVAQITNQTAFVMQGDDSTENIINTNHAWKVKQDTAYYPCSLDNGSWLNSYMVIGPGDSLRAESYLWNWEQPSYNDSAWRTQLRRKGLFVSESFAYCLLSSSSC